MADGVHQPNVPCADGAQKATIKPSLYGRQQNVLIVCNRIITVISGIAVADIFISYARADRDLAAKMANRFEGQGRSIWWDTSTTAGESFRSEIVQQLNVASAVIVLWTENSIKSQWVISEAQRAFEQDKLIPFRTKDIDAGTIPPPFDTLHTPLIDEDSKAVAKIVRKKARQIRMGRVRFLSIMLFVAALAGAGGWYLREAYIDQSREVRYSQPFSFFDKLDDPKLRWFEAEGKWQGVGISKSLTAARVSCELDRKICEINEVQLMYLFGAGRLRLDNATFKITEFNNFSLTAVTDALRGCFRRTLLIDRRAKAVTLVRTKIKKGDGCSLYQEEPLTLTLVDGSKLSSTGLTIN